jgi:selenocysteine lyase/cysteine desulfurase
MLWAWDQRMRRDKVVLKRIQFPVPTTAEDLIRRFEQAITPRTRVLHFCHMTNVTGQIFPVRELSRLARARGILTIVDGAQAVGHFPVVLRELDCDFYGTSLHKWMMAPHGTGFLFVRREHIERLWPLQPAINSERNNIRKFEEIGTHPAANHNAIAEALTFHHGIGIDRKAARLRYLRDRWATRLKSQPKFRLHTSQAPAESCAIGTIAIEGVPVTKVGPRLWDEWRILATPIVHDEFEGLRVTPNVYTTIEEIDQFADAMEKIARPA